MVEEVNDVFGVIDTDIAPNRLRPGDYQGAVNIRNSGSEGSDVSYVQNLKGSQKFEYTLPAGQNTCIGMFSDEENNDVYYFIHNENLEHSILRFDYNNENHQEILQGQFLNFDPDHMVVEAWRIGDQLIFNDAFNEVFRLDIPECINFSDTEVWDFDATVVGDNVELQGSTPPPFNIGDQIFIIRDWRDAWVDYTDIGLVSGVVNFTTFSFVGPGAITGIVINGVNQIGGPIPFVETTNIFDLIDIESQVAAAINAFTPTQGPDFIAITEEQNGVNVIVLYASGPGVEDLYGVTIEVQATQNYEQLGNYFISASDVTSTPGLARFHCYDPNPNLSGVHAVVDIVDNTVVIADPGGLVQDFVTDGINSDFIGGRAYLNSQVRAFNLPMDIDYLKLYRKPPDFTVCAEYESDITRNTNNLRGRLFQFKTRYIYRNGMKSVCSPISKIPVPRFEQTSSFQNLPAWQDNVLSLWFDTGEIDVVEVELLVREMAEGGDQDFRLLGRFNKERLLINSNTSHNFKFFGDEVIQKLPVADTTQSMDYLPELCQAITPLRDRRLAIGGLTEGKDVTDLLTTFEPISTLIGDGIGTLVAEFITATDGDNPSSTFEGNTISNTIWWPLNRNEQFGPQDPLRFITGAPNPPNQEPYWGAFPNGASPTQEFIFSFGLLETVDYDLLPQFWENLVTDVSPSPDAFYINNGDGWQDAHFSILNPNGQPIGEAQVGSTISMFVEFRLLKHLAFRSSSNGGGTPDGSIIFDYPFGEDFVQYPGVLSYARHPSDSQGSYYYISETISKVVEPGDTPNTIKDYFVEQLTNSAFLSGNADVLLGSRSQLNGSYPHRSKQAVFQYFIEIDDLSGSAFRFRPRVEVVPFTEGDDGFDSSLGEVSLNGVASWYEVLGVNRLRTEFRTTPAFGRRGFKTGASHLVGIEYSADGRRATISPAEVQFVPYFNDNGGLAPYGIGLIMRIFNQAPEWATHWKPMYAGNQTMLDWIQFEVHWVIVDDDEDVVQIALSKRITDYNRQQNFGDNNSNLDYTAAFAGRSELSYSWTPGDRLRFITYWPGDQATTGDNDEDVSAINPVEVEILGEATDTTTGNDFAPYGLVLTVDKNSILPYVETSSFGRGSLVEVYTPKDIGDTDESLYYEMGYAFKVTNGQHHGNRLNQGADTPGSNNDFAEIILRDAGDAWVVGRSAIEDPPVKRSKARTVESPSFSDFYSSRGWGPGSANLYNPDAKRSLKKSIIRYSDFLLDNRNGLNRFYEANVFDGLDDIHGLIQRLACPGENLYVFQELNTAIAGVGASELITANLSSISVRSDQVIGRARYFAGDNGIGKQREALVYYMGNFFMPSLNNGYWLMISGSNVNPLRGGRDHDWNTIFRQAQKSLSKVRMLAAFDSKYGELIVHVPPFYEGIPNLNDRPDFEGLTSSYSLPKKGWVTDYKFFPEAIGPHNNRLLSFKEGQLYVHDETEEWNKFYDGEDAEPSSIKLVFNSMDTAIKFSRGLGIDVREVPPEQAVIETTYKGGQKTTLYKEDFKYMEDQWFSEVFRNELTPGVDNPSFNGEEMRGTYFVVELTFGTESRFELYAVSLSMIESQKTIRRK